MKSTGQSQQQRNLPELPPSDDEWWEGAEKHSVDKGDMRTVIEIPRYPHRKN